MEEKITYYIDSLRDMRMTSAAAGYSGEVEAIDAAIEALEAEEWHPIKFREMTEEEKERLAEIYQSTQIYDCDLPDPGEEVLITTKYGAVNVDAFFSDERDGAYFENYCCEDEVLAWRRLPKPYKGGDT